MATHGFGGLSILALLKNTILGYLFVLIGFQHAAYSQNCLDLAKPFSNIDSSIRRIEKCIETDRITDTATHVNTLCHLTTLYNKKSLYVKSEKTLLALIPLIKASRNKKLIGEVYNHLANTYKLSRDMVQSLQYHIKAIKIFESEKDKLNLVKCYTDIAEYYRSLGHYDDARNFIRKALATYKNAGMDDVPKLIRIYNRYAAVENETNMPDSSMFFSLKSLELARQINDKNAEAVSLNEIGFTLKNRKMVDSSMKCYKRAVDLWTETGADADATHGIFNQALLLSHHHFPKRQIIPYYEKIIRLVKEKNIDYPLDQVYYELSNCYFFMGDSLSCFRIRQDYYTTLLQKVQKYHDIQINNIKEKYENEKYKQKIFQVSGELKETEKNLVQTKRENLIIYFLLALLLILVVIIGILSRRVTSSNKTLKVKNKEKDILIQEIHHRVKNNLQFVSSLINLQIHSSKNSAEVDSLSDASRRIRSMALVHEMLYNQDDLKGIEINKYLTELIGSINDIVNSKKLPINFNITCHEIMFETPKAIALGMITSELVSNSIKYAFEGAESPTIDIDLKMTGNDSDISFTVKDNGKGMVMHSAESPQKLGMRLISIFSRQIKGEYSFNNDNGLAYNILFKHEG